ncbi:RNA polymerase II mediator complex subunit [Orbilia oligospora]|uniref:Mediator of RNA polymerase II transcription subunit 12 n=1 Tax=Orbilia oligospora TaxID=2813651 RepID=A0A7C8QPT9_ORBOL|nr:RNA polymerase II mediator complex subunit [Orbilia oligospora]
MSTVTKPRQQRGGRRPSQPHTGPNPSPLVIPGPQSQPQSQSHASTPTSSAQSARAPHSRTSSKSANVIDLTSPTLPTPIRSRGRSGSISKSVAASPSVLRSAAQEAFPPAMPSKGQLVVTNSRKKACYSFPFPTTAQQQQNSQAPFLVSFNNSVPVELKMLPQPAHKKPKRSTRQKVAPQPTTQTASKDNKLKSYMIEPPLGCHSYPFRDNSGKELKDPKFPDFFPWKGTHPEDHVTESAARTGFSDKMHSGEQSSAKVLLAPLIKKNVGVDIISSIFVTILEKRQHIGRINTPSTFKFPPRVTFPGAKKESWLRDLANPDIPLRRLSRTIPLGLRGKELLDECTAKNIPLLRALWYVRCVGANELRSLKRKGAGSLAVGNETKWLREWTQGVVQYLEKGMADCGKDGQSKPSGKAEASSSSSASVARSTWKLRMTYILRLTSQLYSENLLDRGAFLEWYITLLETCSLDKLPLAMLILQIEWDHIVSSQPGNTKSSNGSTSPRKAAIDFLDRTRAPYDIEDVTTMFLALSKDYHQTVKALCEWAVTSLRVGLHRLYFAVRLLRKFSRLGIQIQPPIHDFLLATGGGRRCKKHVYLLISELVRSKHFTAGKYMSWLISRGALMRHGSIDEEQPCYIRLLAEIPVNHQHTPSAQRNLRSNLLLQKGFFVNAEAASLAKAKEIVMDRIPGIFVTGNGKLPMVVKSESAFTFEEIKFLHGLTRNVMSELGFWVCAAVRKRQAQSTAPDNRGVNSLGWRPSVSELPSTISPGEFLLVRKVLEELEDFGVLAEVIKLVSNSENPEILSAAADTLSSNVDVYFAIGIVGDILKVLFDRYKALQVKRTMEHRPVEHYLTTSLFNFAQYQGCDGDIRQSLESDLLLGKTQAMLPHSLGDTLAEFGEGELDEGVEGLLSGTIPVQAAAVTKAFKVLVERVENGFRGTDMAVYKRFPRLLASLRQLDSTTFDPLMENWMIDTIKNTSRPNLAVAFSNMLVAGCFELNNVIRITSEIVGQAGEDSGSIEAADVTELAFQTLALLLDDEDAKLDLTEQHVNDFSVRLCQLKMRLIFEAEISHASDTAESANLRNAVTKAFVSSITEMDSDRGAIWADLVSVLDDTCVSQIRVYTEEMILNAPGFPNASGSFIAVDEGSTDEEGIKRAGEMLARSLISAIDVTAGRNTGGGDMGTWLPPILADKMNVVLQALSGAGGEVTIQSDGVVTGGKETVGKVYKRLRSWVILFLRIVALHIAEFGSPKTSVVEQGRMVIGLCALLENRCVQNDDFMSEFALDVACAIIDGGIEALSMGHTGGVAGNVGATSEWLKGMSRGRLVEYSLKPWEQVSDPTPVAGDNDTSLSMTLFHARKVGGWISKGLADRRKRRKVGGERALPSGEVLVEGLLREPPKKNSFTPDNKPEEGKWYFPDVKEMAGWTGAQEVMVEETMDHTILAIMDRQSKGIPIGRVPEVNLRNNHFQYIVTWYSLGIATSIMFYLVIRRPPRDITKKVRLQKDWA